MRLFNFSTIVLALVLVVALVASGSHSVWAAEEAEGKKPSLEDSGSGKKKDPGDVSGGRFAGDPVYVHLLPMVIPIITDKGAEQLVTFQIDVEVKDFDTADHMHTIMPRVVDALMRHLYGGLGQGSLRNGKMVDVTKIKAKAHAALVEVIGADGIRDVLVQGVSQRML